MSEKLKIGDIVTIPFGRLKSSNTFIVGDLQEDRALLYHPLYPDIYIRESIGVLNTISAYLKDSTERSLDYVKRNSQALDHNALADLESLCMYFVVKRKLTPKQKRNLSQMCGRLASITFNDDLQEAMNFIKQHEGVLDDFNAMWYRNFKGLFTGNQLITSNKQRESIFNIAGFTLAELEKPTINNSGGSNERI